MNLDARIVYGARCTWWDTIRAAAANDHGIPCCPHCAGVLFEVATATEWWTGVDRHAATHPGYRAYVEWLQGRCFPSHAAAEAAQAAERRA